MKLLAALALAAAFLTGCSTPSLNTLASDDTVVTDDGLTGVWVPQEKDGKESKERYIIAAGEDKAYTLTLSKPNEKEMHFSVQIVKLGDHQFIDLTVTREDRDQMGERWGTCAAPMHNFLKFKRDGDSIQIWPLDDSFLKDSLKDGTLKLAHAEHGDSKDLVITASTADLQRFFKAQAGSKDLWHEVGTLNREKAKSEKSDKLK